MEEPGSIGNSSSQNMGQNMGQIMEALGSWAKDATYKMYMCVFYMYYVFFSASFKGGPPLKEAEQGKYMVS